MQHLFQNTVFTAKHSLKATIFAQRDQNGCKTLVEYKEDKKESHALFALVMIKLVEQTIRRDIEKAVQKNN